MPPMNHNEAVREQAVERYLLGELPEDARARFEEHFFDCALCAADLKDGAIFVDALRLDQQPPPSSLLVVAYQNILVLPGLRRSVAVAQAPAVLNNVVLANIDARGTDIPKITAPAHGSFLISVDVPS